MTPARRQAINWLRVYTPSDVCHSDGGTAELPPIERDAISEP